MVVVEKPVMIPEISGITFLGINTVFTLAVFIF
jgi:hypothetical protein